MRYLELHSARTGNPIMFKIEAIQDVVSFGEIGRNIIVEGKTVIAYSAVRDIPVKEHYEDIKKLMMSSDERRFCYDDDVDFRLRYLLREGLWRGANDYGEERFLRYIKQIVACSSEEEASALKSALEQERFENTLS